MVRVSLSIPEKEYQALMAAAQYVVNLHSLRAKVAGVDIDALESALERHRINDDFDLEALFEAEEREAQEASR